MAMVPNTDSTARDFLAIERNFLAQCRFGIMLFLVSSSLLLQARIPTSDEVHRPPTPEPARKPLGILYFLSGICIISLGLYYYILCGQRLAAKWAFLRVSHLPAAVVTLGGGLIFGTCIALLADDAL